VNSATALVAVEEVGFDPPFPHFQACVNYTYSWAQTGTGVPLLDDISWALETGSVGPRTVFVFLFRRFTRLDVKEINVSFTRKGGRVCLSLHPSPLTTI
jgi:hypothetical protein